MNKTTEALKLAEEALETAPIEYDFHGEPVDKEFAVLSNKALAAIREARAEPDMNLNCPSVRARLATIWGYVKAEQEKQEPVAYCCGFENTHPDGWIDCKIFRDGEFTTPLYAASVSAKREWVDLTEGEQESIYLKCNTPSEYINAAIAAFKEKNT